MNQERTVSEDRWAVEISLLVIRVIVGVIFFAHGAQKLFGAFGGPGLDAIVKNMGPVGYLVAIGECLGGAGLVIGFLSRFSAAADIVIMIGAIALVHGKHGFFQSNNGFEYNLALIGLLLPILLAGPGKYSVGRFLPLPNARERTARFSSWSNESPSVRCPAGFAFDSCPGGGGGLGRGGFGGMTVRRVVGH